MTTPQNWIAAALLAVVGLTSVAVVRDSGTETTGGADLPAIAPELNTEQIDFWAITFEELRAEDPAGWQTLVGDATGEPVGREQVDAWQMEVRQRIFERRYGHRYELTD